MALKITFVNKYSVQLNAIMRSDKPPLYISAKLAAVNIVLFGDPLLAFARC
jgi:hypothetical protein